MSLALRWGTGGRARDRVAFQPLRGLFWRRRSGAVRCAPTGPRKARCFERLRAHSPSLRAPWTSSHHRTGRDLRERADQTFLGPLVATSSGRTFAVHRGKTSGIGNAKVHRGRTSSSFAFGALRALLELAHARVFEIQRQWRACTTSPRPRADSPARGRRRALLVSGFWATFMMATAVGKRLARAVATGESRACRPWLPRSIRNDHVAEAMSIG